MDETTPETEIIPETVTSTDTTNEETVEEQAIPAEETPKILVSVPCPQCQGTGAINV